MGEHLLEELGGFDGAAEILRAWREGMAPEPALLVSEWADRHRVLGSRGSAEPGPWRTARAPYLQAVMDALSPSHPARRVVLMKGAQVGGTECGNNWIGYVVHHAPGPMLAVQPTTELAKRFSEQRVDPLLEETPALRERVAPARSRDSGNRQLSKEFPGGQLVMTGANSAVGLRSMPARFLFLDEVDAYPGDVEGEGDPVALAEARARTFGWRRKTLLVSTPTIAGLSRIEREYQATDQRRYFVPCPHCGHMQWLRFERLAWDKGAPETARYPCEACDGAIGERHKTAMLAAGEWRPTADAAGPARHRVPPLGALLAGGLALVGAGRARLGGGAGRRASAQDLPQHRARRDLAGAGRGAGLGAAAGAAGGRLAARHRAARGGWCSPPGPTCSATASRSRSGAGRRASRAGWWSTRCCRARRASRPPGTAWPPSRPGTGRARAAAAAGSLRIAAMAVDTGGEFTADAYRQIRRLRDPALMACRGVEGWGAGAMVARASRTTRRTRGVELRNVATAPVKAELYRRLWLGRGEGEGFPPGWVHLPAGIGAEWVRQLVAERLVTARDRRGFARREWRKLRERNEALDCAVLARAALHELGADRRGEGFWAGLAPPAGRRPGRTPPRRSFGGAGRRLRGPSRLRRARRRGIRRPRREGRGRSRPARSGAASAARPTWRGWGGDGHQPARRPGGRRGESYAARAARREAGEGDRGGMRRPRCLQAARKAPVARPASRPLQGPPFMPAMLRTRATITARLH